VTALTAITLLLPLLAPMSTPMHMSALLSSPLPTNAVVTSVIDGEKGAKGFLTEVARIVKASVAVQGRDGGHLRVIQLEIKELLVLSQSLYAAGLRDDRRAPLNAPT
jgi:hypothetical protein